MLWSGIFFVCVCLFPPSIHSQLYSVHQISNDGGKDVTPWAYTSLLSICADIYTSYYAITWVPERNKNVWSADIITKLK